MKTSPRAPSEPSFTGSNVLPLVGIVIIFLFAVVLGSSSPVAVSSATCAVYQDWVIETGRDPKTLIPKCRFTR